jgi:cytochrome c2
MWFGPSRGWLRRSPTWAASNTFDGQHMFRHNPGANPRTLRHQLQNRQSRGTYLASERNRRRALPHFAAIACMAAASALSGCSDAVQPADQHLSQPGRLINGDAKTGRDLIAATGCGVCHAIPGVPGASGIVGPPLNGFAHRTYIAGTIPNESATLVAWVRNAPSLVPQTAMPRLPVSHDAATHIAAYLYTLTK